MKVKIELNTVSEIANFVLAVSTVKEDVYLTKEKGLKVDGKSFLGVAHASEFANLWCECSADIRLITGWFKVRALDGAPWLGDNLKRSTNIHEIWWLKTPAYTELWESFRIASKFIRCRG